MATQSPSIFSPLHILFVLWVESQARPGLDLSMQSIQRWRRGTGIGKEAREGCLSDVGYKQTPKEACLKERWGRWAWLLMKLVLSTLNLAWAWWQTPAPTVLSQCTHKYTLACFCPLDLKNTQTVRVTLVPGASYLVSSQQMTIFLALTGGEVAKPRFAQFFHGSLASLTIRPGKMESQKVISCLQACKEGLDINSLESLGQGIKVRKVPIPPLIRHWFRSRKYPTPEHARNWFFPEKSPRNGTSVKVWWHFARDQLVIMTSRMDFWQLLKLLDLK